MRCGDCKHWQHHRPTICNWGNCTLLTNSAKTDSFHHTIVFSSAIELYGVSNTAKNDMVELNTQEEFGCNKFEAK